MCVQEYYFLLHNMSLLDIHTNEFSVTEDSLIITAPGVPEERPALFRGDFVMIRAWHRTGLGLSRFPFEFVCGVRKIRGARVTLSCPPESAAAVLLL